MLNASKCGLQFNTALQANTWSSFNILKGAVKAMMNNQKGGSIVLTSASGKTHHSAKMFCKTASFIMPHDSALSFVIALFTYSSNSQVV